MPIVGNKEPPPTQPLYFKSLKELDNWLPGRLGRQYDGTLKYPPSLKAADDAGSAKGKLLASLTMLYGFFMSSNVLQVCHDYKVDTNEAIPCSRETNSLGRIYGKPLFSFLHIQLLVYLRYIYLVS
jgi:hypothetical protein